jgi:hypothetical protein
MENALTAVIAATLLSLSTPAAAQTKLACPGDVRMGNYELVDMLGHRGAEMVSLAASKDWRTNHRLSDLIAPDAPFGLGAGDVGRPLGKGVEGARRLAGALRADGYQFLGAIGLPNPDMKACDEQKIDLMFTRRAGYAASVSFTFVNGRIVDASGWVVSLTRGAVAPVQGPAPPAD